MTRLHHSPTNHATQPWQHINHIKKCSAVRFDWTTQGNKTEKGRQNEKAD